MAARHPFSLLLVLLGSACSERTPAAASPTLGASQVAASTPLRVAASTPLREEPRRPDVVTGPEPDREVDEAGAAQIVLRLRQGSEVVPMIGRNSAVVAIAANGTETILHLLPLSPDPELRCSACSEPSQAYMGMPAHDDITLANRYVFGVRGPRPGFAAQDHCSDGRMCVTRRALPVGQYRLVMRGDTFACSEVSFAVPLTQGAEASCQRIDGE